MKAIKARMQAHLESIESEYSGSRQSRDDEPIEQQQTADFLCGNGDSDYQSLSCNFESLKHMTFQDSRYSSNEADDDRQL